MATVQKIRVIKQSERLSPKPETAPAAKTREAADPARSVKNTVSSWIRDFQQSRVQDTKAAFNSLFKDSNLQTA
jgi:hypothetical protein